MEAIGVRRQTSGANRDALTGFLSVADRCPHACSLLEIVDECRKSAVVEHASGQFQRLDPPLYGLRLPFHFDQSVHARVDLEPHGRVSDLILPDVAIYL